MKRRIGLQILMVERKRNCWLLQKERKREKRRYAYANTKTHTDTPKHTHILCTSSSITLGLILIMNTNRIAVWREQINICDFVKNEKIGSVSQCDLYLLIRLKTVTFFLFSSHIFSFFFSVLVSSLLFFSLSYL